MGANPHEERAGSPLQLKVTVCVDPFTGATVNMRFPDWPAVMVNVEAEALTEKSGDSAALTVCVKGVEVLEAKFASPAY